MNKSYERKSEEYFVTENEFEIVVKFRNCSTNFILPGGNWRNSDIKILPRGNMSILKTKLEYSKLIEIPTDRLEMYIENTMNEYGGVLKKLNLLKLLRKIG